MRKGLTAALVAALGLAVSACAGDDGPSLPKISDLNPFKEKQQPLPGRRIPVVETTESISQNLADGSQPINLPPERANDAWSQPGGEPNNAPGHLSLAGALHQAWSADAGTGSSKTGRVMSVPIVYDGRVYTLDAEGTLSAFSMSGGKTFQVATAPEGEDRAGGHGGGLAADAGRLYVANGFGVVAALDPSSGKVIWQKNVGSTVRAAPTASGDRLYVMTMQGHLYCFAGADGTEMWVARGLPQSASLTISTSPAVDGETIVVPYPSGDLIAFKTSDGSPVWSENLARARQTSQIASMSDAARPAIDAGTVYAVGHAGRMIASDIKTGERLWTLNIPSSQAPWVAGDAVYIVDTSGKLMGLSRKDGKTLWSAQLPAAKSWFGPVLAGGKLWLASSKGQVIGVDAATGTVGGQVNIGESVYVPPIVAQGRMFVYTDSAKLIALN